LYPFQNKTFPSLFFLHLRAQFLLMASRDVLASCPACFSMTVGSLGRGGAALFLGGLPRFFAGFAAVSAAFFSA
jgi:hypothetical protein